MRVSSKNAEGPPDLTVLQQTYPHPRRDLSRSRWAQRVVIEILGFLMDTFTVFSLQWRLNTEIVDRKELNWIESGNRVIAVVTTIIERFVTRPCEDTMLMINQDL